MMVMMKKNEKKPRLNVYRSLIHSLSHYSFSLSLCIHYRTYDTPIMRTEKKLCVVMALDVGKKK